MRKNKKKEKRNQSEINKVNVVTYVYEKGPEYWAQLLDWNETGKKLAAHEISIANYAIRGKVLSDAQAKRLKLAEKRCEDYGFPDIFI